MEINVSGLKKKKIAVFVASPNIIGVTEEYE